MKKYFVSFADKRLHKSLKRIGKQVRETGFFDKVFLFNESDLKRGFKRKFSIFLKPGTFYLCAWKPQVIIQVFEKMKEGDILLYADSGCHLNKRGLKRLNEYFEIAGKSNSGILATTFGEGMPEKHWTKGDTFDYFNCRNNPAITDSPQIQATTFLIRKDLQTMTFLNEWLDVFANDPDQANRGLFKSENLEGFCDHRSDQSFFSILGKQKKIDLISADEVQGSAEWETKMADYPIWAMRDKEIDNSFWANPSLRRFLSSLKRRILR